MQPLFTLLFTLVIEVSFGQSVLTSTPSQDEVHFFVEEEAEFPGGTKARKEYIAKNIIYPDPVHCSLEGNTTLRFVVTKTGEIKDIMVLRKLQGCPECDQEAIRIIQSMPKWTPAKIGSQPVNSYYDLPVKFKVEDLRSKVEDVYD